MALVVESLVNDRVIKLPEITTLTLVYLGGNLRRMEMGIVWIKLYSFTCRVFRYIKVTPRQNTILVPGIKKTDWVKRFKVDFGPDCFPIFLHSVPGGYP